MNYKMMSSTLWVLISATSLGQKSFAYPLLSSGEGSADGVVTIYRDHENTGKFWYLPTAVTSAANPDGRYAYPIIRPDYFSFSYLGQVSAAEAAIKHFVATRGISRDDLAPVPYDTTSNTLCQNVDEESGVKVLYPKNIGGYGEYVPVTVYTRNPVMVPIMQEKIEKAGGINCTVDVTFKGVVDSYAIKYDVHMNTVYDRFEANAHAGSWFWEVDLHTLLENLRREGAIKMYKFEDSSLITADDHSEKALAAFDGVMDQVLTMMFQRLTKLPDGPMEGRGRAFSFRADYRRSSDDFIYHGEYHAQGVVSKNTVVTINVARGGN